MVLEGATAARDDADGTGVGAGRARVLGGDTHVADRLSVFEPHTEPIRKGKIAKPTEFGNLVTIQEAEHQIVTAYDVHPHRPADVTLWPAALDRQDFWPTGAGSRRPRLQLGGQRTGRHRPRRPSRAAAGPEVAEAPGL